MHVTAATCSAQIHVDVASIRMQGAQGSGGSILAGWFSVKLSHIKHIKIFAHAPFIEMIAKKCS